MKMKNATVETIFQVALHGYSDLYIIYDEDFYDDDSSDGSSYGTRYMYDREFTEEEIRKFSAFPNLTIEKFEFAGRPDMAINSVTLWK